MTTKIQAGKQQKKQNHFTTNAHGPGRRCSPTQQAKNRARMRQLEALAMAGKLSAQIIPPGVRSLPRPQRKKKRAS